MNKTFCDFCNSEITKANAEIGNIQLQNSEHKVFLYIGRGESCDGLDFCKYCVMDAVAKCDDRPRQA